MRWARRHRRSLAALAAAAVAPLLASRDHRTGWTVLVAVVAWSLAAASVWADYTAASPDRAARGAARERARVEEIVRRYEARHAGEPPRRRRGYEERQRERVAAILSRYERERASRAGGAERGP